MIRTLDAHLLSHVDIGGYRTNWYAIRQPVGHTFEDLFRSSYWRHYQTKLNIMDIIRVRAEDGNFDVMVTVANKADNGEISMEEWPKYPKHLAADRIATISQAGAAASAMAPSKVPFNKADGLPMVRVEFLEATKWRLRGFDGQEVSRNHPTETEARKAMEAYLSRMGLVMPTEEETAESVAAAKAALEAARAKQKAKDKAA